MATTTSSQNHKHVPSQWPGGFGLYKFAKAATMVNIWTFVALWAINVGINILFSILFKDNAFTDLLNSALSFVLSLAMTFALLESVKDKVVPAGDALRKAVEPMLLLKYIGLSLLLGLILVFSLLLFIVPFFIVLPRLILAPYFLVDRNITITEALSQAWEVSRGRSGLIYGVIGVFIAIGLLALTIIGIPFAIYFGIMYMTATAIVYYYLQAHKAASN